MLLLCLSNNNDYSFVPVKLGRENEGWVEVTEGLKEGDEVVMVGCRVDDPLPAPREKDGVYAKMRANLRVRARLHEEAWS